MARPYDDYDDDDYDDDDFEDEEEDDGDMYEGEEEDDRDCDEFGGEEDDFSMFARPGANSALRAASKSNPRNLPCGTCGAPNCLTPKDKQLGYQCDSCADRDEGGGF